MFDFMLKILPNGRLIVRNNADKSVTNLKANEVSSFFENVLQEQLEAQNEQDAKIDTIKKESTQTYKEWYDGQAEKLESEKAAFKKESE